ncbi:hypothetical protein ACFUTV_04875 [Streptomyces sp. NPDC057298]|uniref:hypothetical protein n=1 Tax=Streptomyces sp. NPDC057298 TaxID=3346091 RepID=UPI0036262004
MGGGSDAPWRGLHGHRLRAPADAVTVRVRDGEVLRGDGPFAVTKAYVAGCDVLECGSLEQHGGRPVRAGACAMS